MHGNKPAFCFLLATFFFLGDPLLALLLFFLAFFLIGLSESDEEADQSLSSSSSRSFEASSDGTSSLSFKGSSFFGGLTSERFQIGCFKKQPYTSSTHINKMRLD